MYVKVTGNTGVVYSRAQLKADNPGVGFPPNPSSSSLVQFDVFPLELEPEVPVADPTVDKNVRSTEPKLKQGVWTLGWDKVKKTDEEKKKDKKDKERDDLKTDADVQELLDASPAEIETLVETVVTDLAGAREMIKRLSRAVSVIAGVTLD